MLIFVGVWAGQFWSLWWCGFILAISFIKPRWFMSCLVLGISFTYSAWQPTLWWQQDNLGQWHHQIVTAQGTIDSWPEWRGRESRFYLSAQHVDGQIAHGRILVINKTKTPLTRGQIITVTGKISPVSNFPGFDYRRYLSRFHVRSLLRAKEININAASQNPLVPSRQWFETNLKAQLPSPNAELAAGVLIGTKSEFPEPAHTRFKTAGLQHLIVVSGSNVAILMILVGWFSRRLGPWLNLSIITIILLSFVFITGADPPVMRAGIFGWLMLLASHLGRLIDIRNLLMLAAVLMGIWNPLVVQIDLSFWLSFAATAGIILGWPLWKQWSKSWPLWPALKLLIGVSFCAQLAVLPILIMNFETFPWVGLVSNLIAEPIIPLTMATSFLAGLGGIFPEAIHKVLSLPALMLTELLHWTALWFGQWPSVVLPKMAGQAISVIWLGIAVWCLFSQTYHDKYWQNLDLNLHLNDDTERA